MRVELFRAYMFDAKHKSFLVPVLRSDWQTLCGLGGHLSWCLWNSHTLKHCTSSDIYLSSYMTCAADNVSVDKVFPAMGVALPVDDVVNIHEVCLTLAQLIP